MLLIACIGYLLPCFLIVYFLVRIDVNEKDLWWSMPVALIPVLNLIAVLLVILGTIALLRYRD